MSDAEAEAWAEELTLLVREEEQRNQTKLKDMTSSLNSGREDPFPKSMSPKFPSDLFKNLPDL